MDVIPDRDLRQREIIPPAKLAGLSVTIIGVGAVGRQVALQLAAIGVQRIGLIDFDVVEAVNLAPQGYLESDLGRLKVDATARLMQQVNSQIHIDVLAERFKRSTAIHDVLFCCVDKIQTRRLIWEAVAHKIRFLADARMSAEVIRALLAYDTPSMTHFPKSFFEAQEAYSGSCTAKSTIFTANIAAGLLVAGFTQWLRGLNPEADVLLNLLSYELAVTTPMTTPLTAPCQAA